MDTNIEELVSKHAGTLWLHERPLRAALAEQSAKYEQMLNDPHIVHINMLKGIIARPSDEMLLHLLGDRYQNMASRISQLEGHEPDCIPEGDSEFSTEGVIRLSRKLAEDGHPILGQCLIGLARQRDALKARALHNFGHAAIQDAIGALEIADHVADPAHASEDDYRAFSDAISGLSRLIASFEPNTPCPTALQSAD